jgi:hypothetical protein
VLILTAKNTLPKKKLKIPKEKQCSSAHIQKGDIKYEELQEANSGRSYLLKGSEVSTPKTRTQERKTAKPVS